jgi:hypothetical protein
VDYGGEHHAGMGNRTHDLLIGGHESLPPSQGPWCLQGLPLLRVGYIRVPGSLYLGSQTPLNGPYYFKLKTDFLKLGRVISWDEGGGGQYDLAENDAALV